MILIAERVEVELRFFIHPVYQLFPHHCAQIFNIIVEEISYTSCMFVTLTSNIIIKTPDYVYSGRKTTTILRQTFLF